MAVEDLDQELIDSISPPQDAHERERIERYLKRPFQTAVGSDGRYQKTGFANLVSLFASFARDVTEVRTEVLASRYVQHATGDSLDKIGAFVQLPRHTNETDAHYRLRIQAQFRRIIGNCTVDDVRETAALLLDVPMSAVQFSEPFETEVAAFRIKLQEEDIESSPVTPQEFVMIVSGFSAGGVDVAVTAEGAFTNRSLQDVRDNVDLGPFGYGEAGYSGRVEY